MAFRPDNMDNVADWGEVLPEEWYLVRISKVQDKDEQGQDMRSKESNEPIVKIQLKVKDEGPFMGRVIPDNASLQAQALGKLKMYYKATGKGIVPGGHDPCLLLDGECYVRPTHKVYQGSTRMEIQPFNIKSVMDGRPSN